MNFQNCIFSPSFSKLTFDQYQFLQFHNYILLFEYVFCQNQVECPSYLELLCRLWCEIFSFFFSRSLKTREKYISFAHFAYFLRKVCLLFYFWMIKLTVLFCFWPNCLFHQSKTSLKEYTNWAKLIYFSLVLGEWEEKKPKYFAPKQRQMKLEDFLKFYELAFSGYLNFM